MALTEFDIYAKGGTNAEQVKTNLRSLDKWFRLKFANAATPIKVLRRDNRKGALRVQFEYDGDMRPLLTLSKISGVSEVRYVRTVPQ